MADFKLEETQLSLPLPIHYQWVERKDAKEVVILLHGYQERAERMSRLILPLIPKTASVLIPNAPFPVPIQVDGGFKEAYAWYFYDFKTKSMLITPDPAITMIVQLLVKLKVTHLPVRIVGFSQGGYFASILAQRLPTAKHVIALSAGFPERYIKPTPKFRLDAVHGAKDTICLYETARDEHKALTTNGWTGEFITLPETAHRIDEAMQKEVTRLISKALLPERPDLQ